MESQRRPTTGFLLCHQPASLSSIVQSCTFMLLKYILLTPSATSSEGMFSYCTDYLALSLSFSLSLSPCMYLCIYINTLVMHIVTPPLPTGAADAESSHFNKSHQASRRQDRSRDPGQGREARRPGSSGSPMAPLGILLLVGPSSEMSLGAREKVGTQWLRPLGLWT